MYIQNFIFSLIHKLIFIYRVCNLGHLFEFNFCNIWKDFKLHSVSKLGIKFTHCKVSFGMKLCIQSWSFKINVNPQLLCIYFKLLPQSLIFVYSFFNLGYFFEFPRASFEFCLGFIWGRKWIAFCSKFPNFSKLTLRAVFSLRIWEVPGKMIVRSLLNS